MQRSSSFCLDDVRSERKNLFSFQWLTFMFVEDKIWKVLQWVRNDNRVIWECLRSLTRLETNIMDFYYKQAGQSIYSCIDVHVLQWMNPSDFDDPITFPPAPT